MPRFFSPQENISGSQILITDPSQIHHIRNVLRIKNKDKIAIFDEYNNEYQCCVKSIKREEISADIKSKRRLRQSKNLHITLACAIGKKARFDLIVEKTTELGVDKIIPLITEHSIVKVNPDNIEKKVVRWQRIAIEATKQCGRSDLPRVEKPKEFRQLVNNFPEFDYIFIPNLASKFKKISFFEAAKRIKTKANVLLLIGPEGDFTQKELEQAKSYYAIMITLGKRVLKVETAAIICVGLLSIFFAEHENLRR